MAFCIVCELAEAKGACEECGEPLCPQCAAECEVCGKRICRTHVQLTSRGRRLCGGCMKRRNAKRKAMLEERKAQEKKAQEKPAAPAAPKPAEADTSFAALMGDDEPAPSAAKAPPKRKATESEAVKEDLNAAPARRDVEEEDEDDGERKVHISSSLGEADLDDPERKERIRQAMGVGVVEPGSTRLELGPVDENRPVLGASGYQPPAWWKYLLAYIAFAVALVWMFQTSKQFKDLLLPWDAPEFQFSEGQAPVVQDTNALRNASNVNQLEFFSQGPFFFIAWVFVLIFGFGGLYILFGTLSSIWWSYRTWRSGRRAKKKDPNENVHAKMDRLE